MISGFSIFHGSRSNETECLIEKSSILLLEFTHCGLSINNIFTKKGRLTMHTIFPQCDFHSVKHNPKRQLPSSLPSDPNLI